MDDIVKQSCSLPRPENTIARSDKTHLWDIQADDEIVLKAKAQISETLRDNLEIVKLALNVYDEYLFVLTEGDRIQEFLKQEPLQRDKC